jgi:hypothetical protein
MSNSEHLVFRRERIRRASAVEFGWLEARLQVFLGWVCRVFATSCRFAVAKPCAFLAAAGIKSGGGVFNKNKT